MTYKLRAGAPFDLDNIFNIPALDAGPFVNLDAPDLIVAIVNGGNFTANVDIVYDGGSIPTAGTASYDPSKIYGPDDIVID